VQAVILAAGRGSRLGDLTRNHPKPFLPLAGVPLLDRLLASLRSAGVETVTVVTGYRASLVAAHAPGCATIRNRRRAGQPVLPGRHHPGRNDPDASWAGAATPWCPQMVCRWLVGVLGLVLVSGGRSRHAAFLRQRNSLADCPRPGIVRDASP
jgi:hypothetical protein